MDNSLKLIFEFKDSLIICGKLVRLSTFFIDDKIELKQNDQSYQQLCKRAGNGWDINVASKIFQEIFEN